MMGVRVSYPGRPGRSQFATGPQSALAATAALAGVFLLFSSWIMPSAMILPVLSLVLLIVGGAIALSHWGDSIESRTLTYKDLTYKHVGAILVFAAFGAAIISDIEQVLRIFAEYQQAIAVR
jgi:glucose uptake protein GlcU